MSFIVCPPFTHLSEVSKTLEGTGIAVGAQNCAAEAKGAYTGEVAASMIAALGCKYVILGHSERRQYYGETSETLNRKMEQAYANDLVPIYCVGENLDEREAGKHFDVVKAQIEEVVYNLTPEQFGKLVIAYEPVWAIGTGKTATAEQAQEIHAYIRKVLAAKFGAAAEECPILYGGSCKPSNAAEIFAKEDVDGGLIGGAQRSKPKIFWPSAKGFADGSEPRIRKNREYPRCGYSLFHESTGTNILEFLSSISRLAIARTAFGSALGLTKWFQRFAPVRDPPPAGAAVHVSKRCVPPYTAMNRRPAERGRKGGNRRETFLIPIRNDPESGSFRIFSYLCKEQPITTMP